MLLKMPNQKANMNKQILAQLLKDAAAAHHVFEQQQGKPDANWPEWYADYIANHIAVLNDAKLLTGYGFLVETKNYDVHSLNIAEA